MRARRVHVRAVLVLVGAVLGSSAAWGQGFHDDFNGTAIDPTRWVVDPGGGTVAVADGRVVLSAPCGARFPYLTPRQNPFPTTGDFVIRIGFRYVAVGIGGNGFGYDYNAPLVCVWQDACYSPNNPLGCGGLRACVGDGPAVYLTDRSTQDTAYHVYQWEYVGGVYRLSVDGVERAQDASERRPDRFFFGHPPYSYCDWTTQEIDFIQVEPYNPVPAQLKSWGVVKATYR